MAMTRILMVIFLLLAVACGDSAAGSGGPGDTEARCEGESLLIHYKECVGDEVYEEEWWEAKLDAIERNEGRVDPEPGDVGIWSCEDQADPSGFAHFCNYNPAEHAGECIWKEREYMGPGSKMIVECRCSNAIESRRHTCE